MAEQNGLSRADQILRTLISNNCSPKSASEISSATGVPISSVMRYLDQMISLEWAQESGNLYLPGTTILGIAHAYLQHLSGTARRLEESAQAFLQPTEVKS